MPLIPTQRTQTVGPGAMPGVRVDVDNPPIEAFGGGTAARGIDPSGLTEQVRAIVAESRRHADEVAQTSFGAQLSDLETRLSVATRERLGATAFSAPQDVNAEWVKATGAIAHGLTTEDQRLAFERMAAMHYASLNANVQHHVAEQRAAYDGQQTDAYVGNELNAGLAGLANGNPDRLALAIDNQKIAIAKHLDRIGASPEQAKQTLDAVASDTHVAALTQLVESVAEHPENDQIAAQYFAQHQDEIVGVDRQGRSQRADMERLVSEGSVLGQSRREAQRIIGAAPTLADALAQVDTIANARVADATDRRVRQHFADLANQVKADRAAAYERAGQVLEQTHDVDRISRADWMNFTEAERITLRAQETHLIAPKEGPGDPEKYLQLRNQSYFNPTAFSEQNILTIPGLNTSQRKELQDRQLAAGRPEVAELTRAVTRAESEIAATQRRIDTATLSQDDAAVTLWTARHTDAVAALEKAHHALDLQRSGGVEPGIGPANGPSAPPPQGPPRGPPPVAGEGPGAHPLARAGLGPMDLRPPTPQMLDDIAKKGPAYARYLRSMGIDAPLVVPNATIRKPGGE